MISAGRSTFSFVALFCLVSYVSAAGLFVFVYELSTTSLFRSAWIIWPPFLAPVLVRIRPSISLTPFHPFPSFHSSPFLILIPIPQLSFVVLFPLVCQLSDDCPCFSFLGLTLLSGCHTQQSIPLLTGACLRLHAFAQWRAVDSLMRLRRSSASSIDSAQATAHERGRSRMGQCGQRSQVSGLSYHRRDPTDRIGASKSESGRSGSDPTPQ